MYKSMFRPEVIRRVELCFFRPCKTSILASDVRNPPCTMGLSLLHFQPCAGSEPDCNCCLSNKYTYMQLLSPEVTRVNFHITNVFQSMLMSYTALQHGWRAGAGHTHTHQHKTGRAS